MRNNNNDPYVHINIHKIRHGRVTYRRKLQQHVSIDGIRVRRSEKKITWPYRKSRMAFTFTANDICACVCKWRWRRQSSYCSLTRAGIIRIAHRSARIVLYIIIRRGRRTSNRSPPPLRVHGGPVHARRPPRTRPGAFTFRRRHCRHCCRRRYVCYPWHPERQPMNLSSRPPRVQAGAHQWQ